MVSPPEEGVPKEARDAENYIIISDLTPCNILPTNSRKFLHRTKLCVFLSVAFMSKVCINIYWHGGILIKKTQMPNPQYTKQKVRWNDQLYLSDIYIKHSINIYKSSVWICCWHIWMHKTLFQNGKYSSPSPRRAYLIKWLCFQ